MRLIVDTDGGIDDAVALLMVLAHSNTTLEAVTTVFGNVPLAQAIQNVKTILDVAQAPPVSIYKGCDQPLLRYQTLDAKDIHGDDGLGGASQAESERPMEAEHAALALIQLAEQYSGQIDLLTLGPLTNLALAVRLEPRIFRYFNRIVLMAGAVDIRGNTSAAAEFNIMADPEAAHIVFDAFQKSYIQPQLISWETTLAHPLTPEGWTRMIEGETPVARLVQHMDIHLNERRLLYKEPNVLWPDPLAAAVLCEPNSVLDQEIRFIEVETGHTITRGQTLVDYRRLSSQRPNARIVRRVDKQQFRQLLRMAVQM
ncbi:MAG: nucleoside hydrolase [Anaerolineae bacterium]|nr:nucleoside hydrolase [Anaerolineae bacterium]